MNESGMSAPGASLRPETPHEKWRKLDRRQWWLWSSTIIVLLLLTVCVGSFSFPGLFHHDTDLSFTDYLNQSVRALVGIVLVFSLYLIYQQTMIFRMRNQIADQFRSIAKVENLTHEVYKLAALDQLTGLYNRRSGEQRLTEEIERAERPRVCRHRGLFPATRCCAALRNAYSKRFADRTSPSVSGATSSWPFYRSAGPTKCDTFWLVSKGWK